MEQVKVMRLEDDALLPTRKHPTDAGMDFYAYGDYIVKPHSYKIVRTGITVEIPEGYFLLIKPKGGNNHIVGAGVVDAQYEPGEIFIKIINYTNEDLVIRNGDAVAQGVYIGVFIPELLDVELIESKSARSASGGIVTQTTFLDFVDEDSTSD